MAPTSIDKDRDHWRILVKTLAETIIRALPLAAMELAGLNSMEVKALQLQLKNLLNADVEKLIKETK